MNRRFNNTHPEEPESEPASETGPDSPSSGDDTKIEEPAPKKRKAMQKRVVSIPIGDVEGSKSKGETYAPSDSWAWRKYGQKPIKGSPYPRGYYRCSSSKGCPARKQVERSRVDPTTLIVTYAHDHNHAVPARKSSTAAAATSSTDGPATTSTTDIEPSPPEEVTVFPNHNDLELGESAALLSQHYAGFGWFDDVAYTNMLESPICDELDDMVLTMREEDESLFADLGELPECSAVFRRRNILSSSAIQCGGITR